MHATYMQFQAVISEVRISVEATLHRKSDSVEEFRKVSCDVLCCFPRLHIYTHICECFSGSTP